MSRRCIFPLSPEEFNPRDTDDEWRAILKYLRTGKDPGHKARKALIRNLRDPDKPCPAFICRALADLFDAKPQRIKIKAHKPPAGSVKYWMAYFIFARIHFDAVEEAITHGAPQCLPRSRRARLR
jgi:hypothetical protein